VNVLQRNDYVATKFFGAVAVLLGSIIGVRARADEPAVTATVLPSVVGERIPSEDDVVPNLHSLGLVKGHANIFRAACPVRDLAKSATQDEKEKLAEAEKRMQHLRELGIRTIISLEDPEKFNAENYPAAKRGSGLVEKPTVTLERTAAEHVGIRFVSLPMRNAGDDSIQDVDTSELLKLLEARSQEILSAAGTGGVLFHCSAGHDRTGLVAAYLRMKYQHWPVDEAIAEMRRYGHNWPKYSSDGGTTSWHETQLRAIAKTFDDASKR
jgi:hypothetical protein